MKRRTFLQAAGAAACIGSLPRPALSRPTTIRWWYHTDKPESSPSALVAKFEAENPDIRIEAQNIPWGGGNDYYTRLFASLIADSAPDCAMVKLNNQAQLLDMEALAPLDDMIASWEARTDVADDIWKLNQAPDGKKYYLPLQYVIIYLYYRTDLLRAEGLEPPRTFDEFHAAAKALTKDDVYGFGMRGGTGGYDNWGPFVLGGGATFAEGGMTSDAALAANRWYVGLATKDKVVPPSAPTDGFRQIVESFKAGRTAMAIHHIGSSNEIVKSLGDKVSAVPVPRAPDGKGWTLFGDESNGIFSSSQNQEAAFRWISFLSSGDNNVEFAKITGQLPITTSGARAWKEHQPRFVAASAASLPFAGVLPSSSKTAEFVSAVWPTNMQQALLEQISPDDMMRAIESHFSG